MLMWLDFEGNSYSFMHFYIIYSPADSRSHTMSGKNNSLMKTVKTREELGSQKVTHFDISSRAYGIENCCCTVFVSCRTIYITLVKFDAKLHHHKIF